MPASERSGPDPAIDTFERAALGGNWTVHNGDVGLVNRGEIGLLSKRGPMLGLGIATWNGSFSADQFSEVVISPNIDPNAFTQVFVRWRARDRQPYGFHWFGQWQLKRDGGPAAPVLAGAPGSKPSPGDTLRIEVVGDLIRGLHNGVEVIRVRDSALTEAGHPGMALHAAGVSVFPTSFYRRWSGGSLGPVRSGT